MDKRIKTASLQSGSDLSVSLAFANRYEAMRFFDQLTGCERIDFVMAASSARKRGRGRPRKPVEKSEPAGTPATEWLDKKER